MLIRVDWREERNQQSLGVTRTLMYRCGKLAAHKDPCTTKAVQGLIELLVFCGPLALSELRLLAREQIFHHLLNEIGDRCVVADCEDLQLLMNGSWQLHRQLLELLTSILRRAICSRRIH